ncbi:MAG: acetyl-CoA decarbonylase/synthase complex subunit delta [Methanomassiliicoccales archaeon]|nr:MAG: acetyl-CoA decarbonylase/synthase complex subunit delta [Methanomassiliicoccales archaeon]
MRYMVVTIPKEKWTGKIREVKLGATSEEGGTRSNSITLGGVNTLPFLFFEGEMPRKPVIAMEVRDVVREDYAPLAREPFEGVIDSVSKWAKACCEQHGAEAICLKLEGTNPEEEDKSPEEAVETVKEVLSAVSVPLLIYGCGNEQKVAKVMQLVSDATKGERCLLGLAEEEKYKSISVATMANDHGIVAFSNLDINLAKQLNILLTDFGVKPENIVMDPLQAGLGYGLEYSYSVIERIRLAALMGDQMLQMPILCDTALAWKPREAHQDNPEWGDKILRGPYWEATTAMSAITAGADMLIMRHPKAVAMVREAVAELATNGGA